MILKLQVPDETYEEYQRQAEAIHSQAGTAISPEELMAAQLDRFRSVSPRDRVVVVGSKQRDRLEQVLGGGSLQGSEDLVSKVERLVDLRIEGIRLHFTPGQLAQLKTYATRNRRSLEDVVKATVHQMSDRFFDYVGV